MYTYKCKINKVIDGDTLDVTLDLGFNIYMNERVRLIGVNTPEVFGPNASPEGKIASEFTKQWVAECNKNSGYFIFTSEKYDAREKYGRCLGTICYFMDNVLLSLNSTLIAEGWGA